MEDQGWYKTEMRMALEKMFSSIDWNRSYIRFFESAQAQPSAFIHPLFFCNYKRFPFLMQLQTVPFSFATSTGSFLFLS